jgi:hypothetical protein
MGIFPYKTVLGNIFFFKKLWARTDNFIFQQGHKHFSGVNDPAEIILTGSMTPWKSINNL